MDPVELESYDATWPARFEQEAERLRGALGDLAVRIEHVGSTSVPGLASKPVIDIMIGVVDLQASADAVVAALSQLGYEYWEADPSRDERMHLVRWNAGRSARLVHVHVAPTSGLFWRELLAFRDRLRSDPNLTAQYEDLKRGLAVQFGNDRDAYTAAKTEFVRKVTRPL